MCPVGYRACLALKEWAWPSGSIGTNGMEPRTRELEAERLEIQGHPLLH